MKYSPEVKILADSMSPDGVRITSFQLTYWRAIHSEVMTHRVFSRCAQSSRAVPIDKRIQEVKETPWGPAHWGTDNPGMSSKQEIPYNQIIDMRTTWEHIALANAQLAEQLHHSGINLHKQIINRILEPYSAITVVLTATDFNNFWSLREASSAQPEMQDLAKTMHRALDASEPEMLKYGEWHLPYISDEEKQTLPIEDQKKISVARCARVSFKPYTGTGSIEKDLALYNKLVTNKHMSPLEHIATPATKEDYIPSNFRGWNQLRKFILDEAVKG